MKKFRIYFMSVLFFIIILTFSSCKKEEKIYINMPEQSNNVETAEPSELPSEPEYSADVELPKTKLRINSAINNIRLIPTSNTEFWSDIDNNIIDATYNTEEIYSNNIRLNNLVNKKYQKIWLSDINTTYTDLLLLLNEDEKEFLTNQQLAYTDYMSNTSSLYDYIFTTDDKSENAKNKNIKGSSLECLNKYRAYSVELKEYIFIKNGKVDFELSNDNSSANDSSNNDETNKTTNKNEDNVNDTNDNKTHNAPSNDYKFSHSNDLNLLETNKFKDMISNHYSPELKKLQNNYLNSNTTKKSGLKTANKLFDYWSNEIETIYKHVYKELPDAQKTLLEKQKNFYIDYISNTASLQESLLKDSNKFNSTFDTAEYDIIIQKAVRAKAYALELCQYEVLITGSINFEN